MKRLLKFSFLLALTMTSVSFTACEGEDGEPGPQGEQGVAGKDGKDGEDGEDLTDDELTKRGNIVATFTGTYEGKAFTHSIDYKYTPSGVTYGSVWNESRGGTYVDVERYVAPESREYVSFSETISENPESIAIAVYGYIPLSDKKIFYMDAYSGAFVNHALSAYSFNSVTGELKATQTATYPADFDYNYTGNDIEVKLEINITLSEVLSSSFIPE